MTSATHGLRRTNADKRRSVETLLGDEEWQKWSNREIARKCGVGNDLVDRCRLEVSARFGQIERYVQRNGTTYPMNTANIGVQPVAPTVPTYTSSPIAYQTPEPVEERTSRHRKRSPYSYRRLRTAIYKIM